MQILDPTGETKPPEKKFPWRQWLKVDDRPRVLDRETDFPDTSAQTMRIYVHQNAKRLGIYVTTKIVQDRYIVFQAMLSATPKPALPDFDPRKSKNAVPKCRHCRKKLDDYSVTFGECRTQPDPNTRTCG